MEDIMKYIIKYQNECVKLICAAGIAVRASVMELLIFLLNI